MLAKVTLSLLGLAGVHSLSNLPNFTQVRLGVVVDEAFIRSEGVTSDQMEEVIRSSLALADQAFVRGEFTEVVLSNYDEVQEEYGEGRKRKINEKYSKVDIFRQDSGPVPPQL